VVRNLEEQPSEGVAAAGVEPADAEDGYPAWDEVTEGASTDKGLAGETALELQGSTAAQEETQALPETSSAEVDAPIPVIRLVSTLLPPFYTPAVTYVLHFSLRLTCCAVLCCPLATLTLTCPVPSRLSGMRGHRHCQNV